MEALQNELNLANQQRDAAQALATQAAFDQAAAQAQTALAVQNLAAANAAAATASAITFALSPALASNALLNYKAGEGIKIYGKATDPLDILYGGDSGALRLFLFKVQQRSTKFG